MIPQETEDALGDPPRHDIRVAEPEGTVGGVGQEARLDDCLGHPGLDDVAEAPRDEGLVVAHARRDLLVVAA